MRSIFSSRLCLLACAISSSLILAGCGGDSAPAATGASSTISSFDFTGTAAVGMPVSGGRVSARCADGITYPVSGTVLTNASGTFALSVPAAALPCALQLAGGTPNVTLYSFVATGSSSTINITPLTDIVTALALRNGASQSDIDLWFTSGLTPAGLRAAAAALPDATGQLTIALQQPSSNYGVTVIGGFDPFTTAFSPVAGNAYDDLLEAVQRALNAQGSSFTALRNNFAAAGSAALPPPTPAQSNPDPTPTTPSTPTPTSTLSALDQLKAVAGTYGFTVQPTLTSSGDIGVTPRGVRYDDGYPACTPLGTAGGPTVADAWTAQLVIAADGNVTLRNPANTSQAISMPSAGASGSETYSVSVYPYATAWSQINAGSKTLQVRNAIAYTQQGHQGNLSENFDVLIGIDAGGVVRSVQLSGSSASPRKAFCPASFDESPTDPLGPLKALAGSYTVFSSYLDTTPTWTGVTIAGDGGLSFTGGAAIPAASIRRLGLQKRANDGTLWALSVYPASDLNGDGTVDKNDVVNIFLAANGTVRDVQTQGASNTLAEVAVVATALPTYDDTLAPQLTGNGVIGRIGTTTYVATSTESGALVQLGGSGRLDIFARNSQSATNHVAWRITANAVPLVAGTTYNCTNGTIGSSSQGTAVLFDDAVGILTSANSGPSPVQPRFSTRAGGSCAVTITHVTNGNGAGAVTAVQGYFRAVVFETYTKTYVETSGYFRYGAAN
ncbi:MAG: hypothetical protein EOO28_30675 [Comamonadaceae bacterium]|nr:MAG: hypothetical protein EOO28_30675 [Comamonadaceae bacterium]